MTEPQPLLEELSQRLDALAAVVEAGDGRLPADELAATRDLLDRARGRLGVSTEHTVVALAGSTGSGKSSLYNAVSGVDLSAVGVRRPTTGEVHACVWGAEGAEPLLDWLGVPARRRVPRDTVLDAGAPSPLAGLVLLDLPDHDSADPAHRREVDRLVRLVDALVWVMDPQKYGDRLVHEECLRPLAGHDEVVVVTLNQIDRLDPADAAACEADLRRLLAEDGLPDARVVTSSATAPAGVEPLRALLEKIVRGRRAPADRLAADLSQLCARLGAYCGDAGDPVGAANRGELVDDLAEAAGVSTYATALADATRRYAARVAGWPVASWFRRLWQLRSGTYGRAEAHRPAPVPAQRALTERAVRRAASSAAGDLPAPWPDTVLVAARTRLGDLADALDTAIRDTRLDTRLPAAYRLLWVVQWALLGCVAAGLALLVLALAGGGSGFVLPGVLGLGGLAAGAALAALAASLAQVTARRQEQRVEAALRDEIGRVGREHVLEPVEAELDLYARICRDLAAARG